MPDNIPITGDDAAWKRSVDAHIAELERQLKILTLQLQGLSKRV